MGIGILGGDGYCYVTGGEHERKAFPMRRLGEVKEECSRQREQSLDMFSVWLEGTG